MEMKRIVKLVNKLTDEIRIESNEIYPLFRNLHEAYGVIKEKKEEAEDKFEKVEMVFDFFWKHTKEDNLEMAVAYAENCSVNLSWCIAELLQMKAMCDKVSKSQRAVEKFMKKPPEKNITVFEKIKQFFIKRKEERKMKIEFKDYLGEENDGMQKQKEISDD